VTAYLIDWCALLVRWLHLITGVAWIGSSFYFVWLDNHLEPPPAGIPVEEGVAGELWAVHGGGFYRSRKYRIAPAVLPPTLHWFYWEAYSTWLSGFALLTLLYFFRADAYLIDPAVTVLGRPAAVAAALASLAGSWVVYDALCRSPVGRHSRALAGVLGVLLGALAWGLCSLFSGRGAFMIFGASLGTIMVANVLFVIIPGQRELVRAKREGRVPDAAPGLKGKQRSVHNTYFTLPVLFVMISNHHAMTYGARHNWLVLIAMSFAGACIRAWFVARHKPAQNRGVRAALPAALAVLTLVGLVAALAPAGAGDAAAGGALRSGMPVGEAAVQLIVRRRCVPCHAAVPTQPGFAAAPNGLRFDSPGQMRAHLPEVRQQLSTHSMPLGNLTGMTEDERATVLQWALQGGTG
jgi:uncharacterized membrane protein